ncbi:hypothetical protein [Sphingomonas sp. dw_22]|uniref:hypothetical protein n=1 Tax=Sphingomonas sp. dw_22 TaxID=2721175 RepID=UPI001BD633D3|nr:hypothetical protein [Sphingomonas sp. dw_22]
MGLRLTLLHIVPRSSGAPSRASALPGAPPADLCANSWQFSPASIAAVPVWRSASHRPAAGQG